MIRGSRGLSCPAILWAAAHPKRERFLARMAEQFAQTDYSRVSPTGNLAKTGYDIQISSEMRDRDAPDDLWRSAPGGFGAHRRFDAAAKSVSVPLWLTTQRAFAAMFILILSPVLLAGVR
jgi:hypothetical protein